MIKVVIADDEQRVCQLIQVLVNWEELGMELAATACNGLEALDRVREVHPDILITDIRMPGCNGIDLIQKARALQPQLEIVIISGYAHFEYAQTAIRYGVGDYLLKPIQKEELNGTLRKLGERCTQRRDQLLASREQAIQDGEAELRLQRQMIKDLLTRRLSAPSEQVLQQDYHFIREPGLLQVVGLKLDYDPGTVQESSLRVIFETIIKTFTGLLQPLCLNLAASCLETEAAAVLNFRPEHQEEIRTGCRSVLNRLVAQKKLFGPVEFSMALSTPVQETTRLPQCVEETEMALQERLLEGTGRLLERVPAASGLAEEKLSERYFHAAEQFLETQSLEDADRAVEQLRQAALAVPGVCGRELLDLVRTCGKMIVLRTSRETDRLAEEFEARCTLCSQVSELFSCLQSFQHSQILQLQEQRQSEKQRPIRIAKQFIQKNYMKNITLEDVAEATDFSVSYFSAMFKKETGEGFSKYLTRVRMDRARELLQETGMPISEICEAVGYGDMKHFNQTFKKTTNLTPGQYRKLYG